MSAALDLLATDVLSAGGDLLDRHPSPHLVRVVGIEFGRHPRVSLLVSDDDSVPPRLLRLPWPAKREDAELVHAGEALAAPWVNSLPDQALIVVAGAAIDLSGASLRIYARPATGEVALALRHQGQFIEIARRIVVRFESVH